METAKAKAARREPSEAFVARMAELEKERAALTEKIESLKNERDGEGAPPRQRSPAAVASRSSTCLTSTVSAEKLAAIKEEALSLAEKLAEVDAEASEDIPRIRYAISLYANITNIRWDFEKEDVLAGCECRAARKRLFCCSRV